MFRKELSFSEKDSFSKIMIKIPYIRESNGVIGNRCGAHTDGIRFMHAVRKYCTKLELDRFISLCFKYRHIYTVF